MLARQCLRWAVTTLGRTVGAGEGGTRGRGGRAEGGSGLCGFSES